MAAIPNLTRSTLKVILDSNSKLVDFMMQNSLDFTPCRDGITFCVSKAGMSLEECKPAVTIRWARNNTYRLKRFGVDSFQADPKEFVKNRPKLAATALVAKSIMALYLAACTDICASPYVKKRDPQTNQSAVNAMLSTLKDAINCGDVPKESVDRAFFFKPNMLPSQIVDSVGWNLPADFDRFADLSFVWLRNRWTTWANCFEFHEAAPCGKRIYDSAFADPSPKPLNYVISDTSAKDAIIAMHDTIYSEEAERFKNEDVFDVVCKPKT